MESVADRIRHRSSCLPDLRLLDLDPKIKKIYGKLAGDDLFIINEFHQSRCFRKIHLEIARIGSTLEILHCVFFPEPTFDLPIFGVDIVATEGVVSAAIVDLSPVGENLPSAIEGSLKKLNIPTFRNVRKLPEWGCIFSEYVQFIRPDSRFEAESFLSLVDDYLNILISISKSCEPDFFDSPLTIERYAKQQFYCLQQKRNDKTRNVLAKTFSPQWADEYIDIVLFNCPMGYLDS